VNNIAALSPKWLTNGLLGELDISGFNLDLNIPRNDVVRNEKFEEFRQFLEEKVADLIDKAFEGIQMGSVNQDKYNMFSQFFRLYLKIKEWDFRSREYIYEPIPRKFIKTLRKFYFFKCLLNGSLVYRTWNALINANKPINLLQTYFYGRVNPSYATEIVTNCSSLDWDGFYIFENFDIEAIDFLRHHKKEHKMKFSIPVENVDISRVVKYTTNKRAKELRIFPATWKIVKFHNYRSKRMVESFLGTVINEEHRFIDLLLKSEGIISGEGRKQIVLDFLRTLRRDLNLGKLHDIQRRQKNILRWFQDAGTIASIENYILTKDDFPPTRHW